METTAINGALNVEPKSKKSNSQNAEGVDASAFAMLFQGIVLNTSQQPLANTSQAKVEKGEMEQLISSIADILESSEQPKADLMKWLTGLAKEDQKAVKMLFSQLLGTETSKHNLSQYSKADLKVIEDNVDILKTVMEKLKAYRFDNMINQSGSPDKSVSQDEIPWQLMNQNGPDKSSDTLTLHREKTIETTSHDSQNSSSKGFLETKIDVKTLDFSKMQFQHHITNQVEHAAKASINPEAQKTIDMYVNKENFTAELGKVLIRNLKLPNGTSETKIQLHPQELGEVLVKLTAKNGEISAQILAKTALGKEMLEAQVHQLKQSLMHQGYQVEKIEVQQAPASTSTLAQGMKSNFNFSGQQHSSDSRQHQQGTNKYHLNFAEETEEFTQHLMATSGINYTV